MALLVHSKYMSGVLARHALRGMQDVVGNEDGQIGEVPRDLYLNVHPLLGGDRLESHHILGRVLESVFETLHESEIRVRHPQDLQISTTDTALTGAVSDALNNPRDDDQIDFWAADEDLRVKVDGRYMMKGIPVGPFTVEVSFCPSWQSHNGMFEELYESLGCETMQVSVDEFQLEKLPVGYRFHVDALGEEDQLAEVNLRAERQPVRLVSVGRVVVERYTIDVAQALGQLCGDRAWLEEKQRPFQRLRVWAVDAWERRALIMLGGPNGGLLYVGQVDV